MSTVKISELIELPAISANTSNTIFLGVDLPTQVTGKFTATTLAQQLYANNYLNVGNHSAILPNAVGQFAGESDNYLQVSIQNDRGNGSSDYVITGDNGTDVTNYIDMGFAGSTYNYPGYTVYKPSDGYLLVQGGTDSTTPGGNLAIGVVTQNRDIVFFQGGAETANIVARFSYGNGFKLTQKPIIFADGTSQNTAASPASYSQEAFATANTNASNILYINAINNTQNSNISYVISKSESAFNKANAALANASGIFAGDLTITGNTTIKTKAAIHNASIPGNTQHLIITGTAGDAISTPSNPGYTIHTATDGGNRIVAESYSNISNDYASFIGRRARGTAQFPAAVQNNDIIVRFGGNAYGTTKFSQFSDARIEFVATENHTDAARGSKIRFMNTPDGANVAQEIATFNANTVSFTGSVIPEKGFVFTPRLLEGAQTAITIDYSSDSIIKASCSADVTISHSNFTYGKVVEVWLTNTGAQNRTVTHGVSAINSTTKSTAFTITASSSAYMRFFSIDGDLANTFVTVSA
jgi:hypothetical protein